MTSLAYLLASLSLAVSAISLALMSRIIAAFANQPDMKNAINQYFYVAFAICESAAIFQFVILIIKSQKVKALTNLKSTEIIQDILLGAGCSNLGLAACGLGTYIVANQVAKAVAKNPKALPTEVPYVILVGIELSMLMIFVTAVMELLG